MKRNKRTIKYKKERVVLSDVLPFEVPITFSNRHFYDFLIKNKIELSDNKIKWEKNEITLNTIIKLLFGLRDETITTNEIEIKKCLITIPFNYKISHKENDFRELTIIHPINQLVLIEFYEVNKQLLLHYCSLSPFSIRRAEKVAKFIFHKDKTHKDKLSENQDYEAVEEYNKEYESLKTFFVYKNYSNIHKFYESYKYHRCEKKYNKLFKFDISKCFDSIYTHSISWALLNKEIVKDTLSSSRYTFGGKFDTIMQNLNYGETNGIVIGPEFSRIFAELILQRIDRNVETILREKEDLNHKIDYEIFRYVDDFFVFYNEESTKDKILKHFRLQLKDYKLYLNDAKTILYETPIITEITIAKQKITELLSTSLTWKIDKKEKIKGEITSEETSESDNEFSISIFVSSNKLITKFKTIIKETGINYKDILNYSLSLIERKVDKILIDYQKLDRKKISEKEFTEAILEILDFTFFLYSVSPRVNTTIKLCRILRSLSEFLSDKNNVNIDFKHLALKKIYDNIYFTLQKNKSLEHTQVETLYLLIALGELGKEYWLDADVLRQYVCIDKNKESGALFYKGSLNYFAIIVLLFYMKDKKRYTLLRSFLQDHIRVRFNEVSEKNIGKTTELVYLLFDILTCPYLDLNYKREILTLHGVTDLTLQDEIINTRKYWFTKWTDFDFGKELDVKHSQEVY
jgi:hypothetical protein